MALIDVEIDGLTNSIVDVVTRQSLGTTIQWWEEIQPSHASLAVWSFDWMDEWKSGRQVAGLFVRDDAALQGLISMEPMSDHMLVHLVESAPHNVGRGKRYIGVPGNLFAFACANSRRAGFDGTVSFQSKSELTGHYIATLGASRIGESQRMIINEHAASHLIELYFKDDDQWSH